MSKIEWTEETWNPVTGCTKVSPGCDNCYAEKMSHRLAAMGVEKYRGVTKEGVWTGRVRCHAEELNRPLRWKKPRMVFVCSMSDLFHPDVPMYFICAVFETIIRCPQHTFQILTKRASRVTESLMSTGFYLRNVGNLGNVWYGFTAENQSMYDLRGRVVPYFPTRFLSVEPMLGPVRPSFIFNWAIFGCESGANRRRCPLEWVRESVDHCQNNGIKVFIKQLDIDGRVEKDINKFPTDLQIREWPEEP